MKRLIPPFLIAVGILLLVTAATLLHPAAGIATAGLSLLAAGVLLIDLERP